MSQQYVQEDSTKFFKNLPKDGMIVDGLCYRRVKLERCIVANDGSFSLPTPNTLDHLPPRSQDAMRHQFLTARKGRTKPANLREIFHPELYPERLGQEDQSGLTIPTLKSRDYKDPSSPEAMEKEYQRRDSPSLGMELAHNFSLPTMCANEYKGSGYSRFIHSPTFRGAKMSEGLRTCATDPIYLNPSFGEKVMSYEIGWTELSALATRWYHFKSKRHSKG